MTGRHRLIGRRARPARVRTVDMVDARDFMVHLMTPDAVAAGRGPTGRYITLCGKDVLPAALEEPGHRPCLRCLAQRGDGVIPSQRPGGAR